MSVDKNWLEEYNKKKSLLCPENPLEKYFTDKEIAGHKIDTIELGNIKITSGEIVACDPVSCLDNDVNCFFDKFPKGEFPVTASVFIDNNDDYNMDSNVIVARIKFNNNAPVTYREALYGTEDLSEVEAQGDFFGVICDSGLTCFVDRDGYDVMAEELVAKEEADEDFDAFTDIYAIALEKNAKDNPKHQMPEGDWLNREINDTNNATVFVAPYGPSVYPVYVAEDKDGNICQLVIQFIDLELQEDEDQ